MAEEEKVEYLDEVGLKRYDELRKTQNKNTYVQKEHKTGSEEEYKVLTDNNLTDELVDKIEESINQEDMESYVDSKLGSAYKPAGSIESINELPALEEGNLGKVYNVETAFVTTANFLEGAGKDYPPGTNVVVVESEDSVYKYDVLAGFFDMSRYVEEGTITAIPISKIDSLFS